MAIGPIAVEATDRGVSTIELGAAAEFVLGETAGAVEIAGRALDQIYEYLTGVRREFDLPLDLTRATPFRRVVLDALTGVPYGQTTTYGDLARRVGSRSARAVGQAVGWNPLPIVIPCHRVLAANGQLGGYSAGLSRKRRLLELEGIVLTPRLQWRAGVTPPRSFPRPG
jgi:methylated-DNA-[protein]-cysteine S-methyltransferase